MANPEIYQGTLNKLLANVVYADNPILNLTSPFLGSEQISIAFEGQTAQLIGTTTGAVSSPEPYVFAVVTMAVLKTNALGLIYKTQIETNTVVGRVAIIPDTTALSPFLLDTCILESIQDIAMNGNQPEMTIRLRGVYRINNAAFFNS